MLINIKFSRSTTNLWPSILIIIQSKCHSITSSNTPNSSIRSNSNISFNTRYLSPVVRTCIKNHNLSCLIDSPSHTVWSYSNSDSSARYLIPRFTIISWSKDLWIGSNSPDNSIGSNSNIFITSANFNFRPLITSYSSFTLEALLAIFISVTITFTRVASVSWSTFTLTFVI